MLCSATGLSLFSSPKCLRGERPCSFVTATLTYFTSFSLCGRVEKGQTFLYLHFWHTLRATRLVAMVNRPLHMCIHTACVIMDLWCESGTTPVLYPRTVFPIVMVHDSRVPCSHSFWYPPYVSPTTWILYTYILWTTKSTVE